MSQIKGFEHASLATMQRNRHSPLLRVKIKDSICKLFDNVHHKIKVHKIRSFKNECKVLLCKMTKFQDLLYSRVSVVNNMVQYGFKIHGESISLGHLSKHPAKEHNRSTVIWHVLIYMNTYISIRTFSQIFTKFHRNYNIYCICILLFVT